MVCVQRKKRRVHPLHMNYPTEYDHLDIAVCCCSHGKMAMEQKCTYAYKDMYVYMHVYAYI